MKKRTMKRGLGSNRGLDALLGNIKAGRQVDQTVDLAKSVVQAQTAPASAIVTVPDVAADASVLKPAVIDKPAETLADAVLTADTDAKSTDADTDEANLAEANIVETGMDDAIIAGVMTAEANTTDSLAAAQQSPVEPMPADISPAVVAPVMTAVAAQPAAPDERPLDGADISAQTADGTDSTEVITINEGELSRVLANLSEFECEQISNFWQNGLSHIDIREFIA